jgi:tripartite-type tricarboxylate transporter receptor subunit TctC
MRELFAKPSRFMAITAAVAAAVLCPGLVLAQSATFPTKAIRLVVPFPAGGGTDTMARTLGDLLSKDLGQTVVIENKAGAGTVIGNDFVAKSAPDGHTLLINTNAFAAVVALHAKLPYGGENAFSAVTLLGRAPNVAVVNADSSLKSGADFLSYAKANPGKLSYGSAGNGTSTHLAAELLKSNRQFFITHIPYRGATPAITDLMGGQVDVVFGTLPSVAPFIASGKLRALAVTSTTRSALLPHVPTFAESGAKGYEADVWYGIFVAAGTPMPIVQQLNAALKRVTATPEFKKRAQGEGLVISMETPEEAQAIVRADVIKWRKVVQAQSIKPD